MTSIICNGYNVKITNKFGKGHPYPDYWDFKKIIIYDPANSLSDLLERTIVQYLYDEGFVEDRRTEVEIKHEST
jgi:hypothetical protein